MKLTRWEVEWRRMSRFPAADSDIGLRQFRAQESCGIAPAVPDPFYLCLRDGKIGFGQMQKQLEDDWLHPDRGCWPGVYVLWLDWEGREWMLRHLLGWMKKYGLFEHSLPTQARSNS